MSRHRSNAHPEKKKKPATTATNMATPSEKRLLLNEYKQLCLWTTAICVGSVLVHHLLFSHFVFSFWIFFEILFESIFAIALFSLCRSKTTVLAFLFIGTNLFRALNTLKETYLDTPILPADFFLLKDVAALLGVFKSSLFAVGILGFFAVALFFIWKHRRRRPLGLYRWGVLPAGFYLVWLFVFPHAYYNFFDYVVKGDQIGKPFQLKLKENELGIQLTFTTELARYLDLMRTLPTEAEVRSALSEVKSAEIKKSPAPAGTPPFAKPDRNVYVILTETFWDPATLFHDPKIPEYLDPDFLRLWEANGHHFMHPPVFGGNTANTEFELLCGMPAKPIARSVIFQTALFQKVPCLPELLKAQGYRTFALHPFAPGFFNRSGAFPLIGFDQFFSLSSFESLATWVDNIPVVPDAYFLREAIRLARQSANGKPFLAYMMTFAGHWPFAWLPEAYKQHLELPGASQDSGIAMVERHLNLNWNSSTALNETVSEILKDDPRAIIVISGDHLPGLAQMRHPPHYATPEFEALYFQTPLLIIDGQNSKPLEKNLGAYNVANEILDRLGLPESARGHFPWFVPPDGEIIRPTPEGSFFVMSPKRAPADCSLTDTDGKTALCNQAVDWIKIRRILGKDLVVGSQFSQRHQ
jgi:phosphoglycerol transferase MdoB-like AlkP superfamily enzyme